jgi:hypothetical protein
MPKTKGYKLQPGVAIDAKTADEVAKIALALKSLGCMRRCN